MGQCSKTDYSASLYEFYVCMPELFPAAEKIFHFPAYKDRMKMKKCHRTGDHCFFRIFILKTEREVHDYDRSYFRRYRGICV